MNIPIGSLAALGTAILWTFTSIFFEFAARRIGSLVLNFLRLLAAFLFLTLYGLFVRGQLLPLDASSSSWLWLSASGLVGFVLGDLCLFQAYIDIGARFALLIYATTPIFTSIIGFFVFGEGLSGLAVLGILLTLAAIALVISGKPEGGDRHDPRHRLRGILLAVVATIGQAGGLILGKLGAGVGIGAMDPFAGTQIRVIAGLLGFALIICLLRSWPGVAKAFRDGRALASLSLGAFLGPFLGVSLSLLAVQRGNTGIASAIMSISPVLVIAPSALVFKEKVKTREVLGAVVAVLGVFLLFLA